MKTVQLENIYKIKTIMKNIFFLCNICKHNTLWYIFTFTKAKGIEKRQTVLDEQE